MSLMDVFSQTGVVVKLVLLVLIIFSVVSWGIIFSKRKLLALIEKENESFLRFYRSSNNLKETMDSLSNGPSCPFKIIFEEGYRELGLIQTAVEKSAGESNNKKLRDYFSCFGVSGLERALENGLTKAQLETEKKMSFLASVGSAAPFIGLFGTVWGIMDSFQGFASGGATIEKIAPGIAEALIATAIGLAVAIPAVLFFNYFSNQISALSQEMENFKREFINAVERTLV